MAQGGKWQQAVTLKRGASTERWVFDIHKTLRHLWRKRACSSSRLLASIWTMETTYTAGKLVVADQGKYFQSTGRIDINCHPRCGDPLDHPNDSDWQAALFERGTEGDQDT